MAKLLNRAGMTTATTGTGTITLGSAITDATNGNMQTFAAAGIANADVVSYLIVDGNNWEIGRGTYTTTGTTLARTTITASSSAGSAITLSGTAKVYQVPLAADLTRVALNVGTVALTSGATVNTDASLGNVFTLTLGINATLANPTNLVAGATYMWIITQDGTGSRTLAYGTTFSWPGGTAPTLTTTAAGVDTITAIYDGTKLRAIANKAFA